MAPKLLAASFDRETGEASYVYRIEVSHSELVPTEDGKGKVSRQLPPTLEDVVINMNLATVARSMGATAARSKGGKSSDGFVTVTHQRPKKGRTNQSPREEHDVG
jgi:hypothetical protein